MPSMTAQVKKQVFAEFKKAKLTLSKSGKTSAEKLWRQTIGNFFKKYGAKANTKWRKPVVKKYGMRAVRAIVRESGQRANGKPVTAAHITKAAQRVIPKFRRICPKELKPKAMNPSPVSLHGGLCEMYK